MKYFIKTKLTYYIRLKKEAEKEENKEYRIDYLNLSQFAHEILFSVHDDTPEADKYVRSLIKEYSAH